MDILVLPHADINVPLGEETSD